ncbi:hypothetical protein [Oligoflexus tunisiensis]|uniref:hypothetical protein n=1 Tax=Oligoflexus tunisiensis TaxID=708132 RepID=UPI00114D03DC|nr:hypothetical protein [Oligoflexus tunisiensis]
MNSKVCHLSLLLATGLGLTSVGQAQPVTEQIDRFELNYSTMRIRFYGEATVDFAEKGFEGAEKVAVEDGLMYVLSALSKARAQKGLNEEASAALASELTRSAYVYNTTYFTDGRVRVELDSSLSRAMDFGVSEFASEEPKSEPSEGSAIVVQISGLKVPLLQTEIRSTDGELLFSPKDVARSAYKKQLAGRWFFKNSGELKSYAGPKPIEINAVAEGDKTLIVTKDSWSKLKADHPRLLEEAKLAFVIAGPGRGQKSSN